jgi:type II secretory pathway pseudopilin PulG
VAIIGIIAAIAIPGLLRARQSGNEASGIGSMRAINSAQSTFAASCGSGFYATTLVELGTPPAGGTAFIGEDLGAAVAVTKSTYLVTLGASTLPAPQNPPPSCNGAVVTAGYNASATPGDPSMRHFATNTSGTIFFTSGPGVAVDDLNVLNGTPLQ